MCRQAARPVAGRLSEDRIDSAPEGFGAALDPRALHQASLMAGRLAMHLQGKMPPNQVHVRMAVYPALQPRCVTLQKGHSRSAYSLIVQRAFASP